MKNCIINFCMQSVKSTNDYDDTKLEEIQYGLESIYLTITKLVVIFLIAYLLNMLKELVIFLIFYNMIRATSFGLHATKSWICLLSSLIIFILVPLICNHIFIPIYLKSFLGIILIFLFYRWAPADTKKRPIINTKRRQIYKLLSIIIIFVFTLFSLIIDNNFISNSLLLSLVVQCFMICPIIYKIFKLPYDNYKSYTNLV